MSVLRARTKKPIRKTAKSRSQNRNQPWGMTFRETDEREGTAYLSLRPMLTLVRRGSHVGLPSTYVQTSREASVLRNGNRRTFWLGSLGGNAATSASGRSSRYRTMSSALPFLSRHASPVTSHVILSRSCTVRSFLIPGTAGPPETF